MRGPAFLPAVTRNGPKAAGPRVPGLRRGRQARGDGLGDELMRRLAGEPGRDIKPVHRDGTMLTATGLIERRAADEVAVGWDRAVTELDLAA